MPVQEEVSTEPAAQVERDFETYKVLLNLWSQENPIKTTKLQVLLIVNGLLVSALNISGKGFTADQWFMYLAGVIFNVIWTFSIGRTALFQEAWQVKLRELRDRYPTDPRFSILETRAERAQAGRILRTFGGVSSRWYLLLSPVFFAVIWLVILIFSRNTMVGS
jgi:hypothetical protein